MDPDPCPPDSLELESDFFHRFAPTLRRYIARRLGGRLTRWVEVEDVLQRVMLEALEGLPRPLHGLDEDLILGRLKQTAKRRLIDMARKLERVQGESAQPTPFAELRREMESEGPVTAADQRRLLRALVEHLPPPYQNVVRACGLEGRSFVECAADLGLEPDTVRKRYYKARQMLIRKIRERRHGR